MNILDIIDKKRINKTLNYDELSYAFNGFLDNSIKDYQMSSLLMAICINDLSEKEILDLVDIFIKSGEILDLSDIKGIKVDKHSTGGVGDKTTMIVLPIVASCGVYVPKMSGRGLGYTGGTIDKLESIPGFLTTLSKARFHSELKNIKMVVCSQTANLTPLDKVVYDLRDVTATVESIPLIAVSIMSKKIASGADKILIDIKVGKGALIKNMEEANKLKSIMMKIGVKYNREIRCLITDMSVPLGMCVGNSLEVVEALEILNGNVRNNLSDLCLEIAANMISMGKNISLEDAYNEAVSVLDSKDAYNKFIEFVKYQQGNIDALRVSDKKLPIKSNKKGVIKYIDALKIAEISVKLGSGRMSKDDIIDHSVGVFLNKLVGDSVEEGEVLCTLYVGEKELMDTDVLSAYVIE